MNRLLISFSGGETSAFMTYALLNGLIRHRYDDMCVVFANTGQENEQTLEFVRNCDQAFGFGTVWVEADIQQRQGVGPRARIVNFASASRGGEPFEAAIRKYGIPNSAFKNCTRNLKLNPMLSYLRSVGWPTGSYDTAIGIRNDEIDRISGDAEKNRLIYPLVQSLPTTKPEINDWWRRQPFRLQLKGYQGNCKWCWKKSFRKHFTLLQETPDIYDFPERMESQYGLVGPEFVRHVLPQGYRRTFFRGGKSVQALKADFAAQREFVPAPDDSDVYVPFDPMLDLGGGCEESCEVFADEDSEQVAP